MLGVVFYVKINVCMFRMTVCYLKNIKLIVLDTVFQIKISELIIPDTCFHVKMNELIVPDTCFQVKMRELIVPDTRFQVKMNDLGSLINFVPGRAPSSATASSYEGLKLCILKMCPVALIILVHGRASN